MQSTYFFAATFKISESVFFGVEANESVSRAH